MRPRITIITICFNNLSELLTTCASVDSQTVKPYEHWIIDGSTNDEIKNYLNSNIQPKYRNWISEPDKGIADAFNKGINRSSGDIINMLNSADYYVNENILKLVLETFTALPRISWVHGKYKLLRGGLWVTIGKPFDAKRLYRGMRSVAHQSIFVKKQLHDQYGLYDSSIKIAMDYDFVCRIAKEPFAFIDNPLVVFAPEGTSSRNYMNSLVEARSVYEKRIGFSFKLILWQLRLKFLYYLIKSPIGKVLYKAKVKLKMENM
jgi:glycosyltransferase involved in cell wall biosynthesis